MLKQVWRMNTGNGVPSDRPEDSPVLEVSGRLTESGYNNYNWSFNYDDCYPITAYQTNRTKPAKCEQVECGECKGMGALRAMRQELTECRDCDGRGYMLELKNDI